MSGAGNKCKITALNSRGRVLLEPVMDAMRKVVEKGTCTEVTQEGDIIHVTVAPPNEVGSFSEEDRSRQVSHLLCYFMHCHAFIYPCTILL